MSNNILTGIIDCFVQDPERVSQNPEQRICDNRQFAIGHFFLFKKSQRDVNGNY